MGFWGRRVSLSQVVAEEILVAYSEGRRDGGTVGEGWDGVVDRVSSEARARVMESHSRSYDRVWGCGLEVVGVVVVEVEVGELELMGLMVRIWRNCR